MDNKEKARITYELLRERKKRREKGKRDAINFIFDQTYKYHKERNKIIKRKYRGN